MEAAGQRFIWHPSKSDWITIWNLSDLHVGAKGCAESEIRKDVKAIAEDPYSFWLGGGDYGEFIGHTDKRFDPDAVAPWVSVKDLKDIGKKTMTRVRDILHPIREKCLGLLIGNHEEKYELHTEHESLHHWLCQELGAPYLGYCCLMDLHFCRVSGKAPPSLQPSPPPRRGDARHYGTCKVRVFAHHGAGYATTPGGKLNKLIAAISTFDAELFFLGHVHDSIARREPMIGCNEDCTKIVEKRRLGLISGSYLKTYNQGSCGYGEQKMYKPTTLGAAAAKIHPESGRIEAVI